MMFLAVGSVATCYCCKRQLIYISTLFPPCHCEEPSCIQAITENLLSVRHLGQTGITEVAYTTQKSVFKGGTQTTHVCYYSMVG